MVNSYLGIYTKLCCEMKTYIYAKDAKVSVLNAQQVLLSFYDCMVTYKNFEALTKEEFKDCYDRVHSQKCCKKIPDTTGLSRMSLLAPPPPSVLSATQSTG